MILYNRIVIIRETVLFEEEIAYAKLLFTPINGQ